jgi:hypothetical protein
MFLCAVNVAYSKPPAVQSHKPTTDDRNNPDERHTPDCDESSFETGVLEALRAIESEQETARAQDQANEKRWWPPSPSWAIVYVTVIYVIVAIFQWTAIHRQANFAEQSLTVVERAYIDVQLKFEESKELVPDTVRITIPNKGRTPAILTAYSYVHKVYEVVPPEPEYSAPEGGELFLAPDDPGLFASRTSGTKPLSLTADQWEGIKAGTRHLCIVGFVAYRDASGAPHKTGFGWKFDAERTKASGKPTLWRMDETSYNYWK